MIFTWVNIRILLFMQSMLVIFRSKGPVSSSFSIITVDKFSIRQPTSQASQISSLPEEPVGVMLFIGEMGNTWLASFPPAELECTTVSFQRQSAVKKTIFLALLSVRICCAVLVKLPPFSPPCYSHHY